MRDGRYFVGADYGTRRVAFFVLHDDGDRLSATKVWTSRYSDEWDDFAVYDAAYTALDVIVRAFGPLVIAIESPIVGASKNAQTALRMSMMAGALAASAGKGRSSGIVLVPPSSWKASVVGRGNATKRDVADWLHDHHPTLYTACQTPRGKLDQDAADAACLALHARGWVGAPG